MSNSSSVRAVADTEHLVIDHVGQRGDGVVTSDGISVYVPYALGGETIEVEQVPGHPDRRRLIRIERASPERIAPLCPHFGVCGGCAIQHWEPERYRAWKRGMVVAMLAQAGIGCEVAPLVDAHGLGRRRITLHARLGTHDVLKVGFAASHSHEIIPINRCPILDPHLDGALEAAWALAEPLISVGKPLDIQITATSSGLDVDVRGSGPLATAMIGRLSRNAGRKPTPISETSNSAIPGTTRQALSRSRSTASAVMRLSNPCSSAVAPTTSSPSALGTR